MEKNEKIARAIVGAGSNRRKNDNMLSYMCKTKTSVIKRKLTKEDINYDNYYFY